MVKSCPKCGRLVQEQEGATDAFCERCGTELAVVGVYALVTCPGCGHSVPDGQWCIDCAAALAERVVAHSDNVRVDNLMPEDSFSPKASIGEPKPAVSNPTAQLPQRAPLTQVLPKESPLWASPSGEWHPSSLDSGWLEDAPVDHLVIDKQGYVKFGHYSQGNDKTSEAISWRVLEVKDNAALLLSGLGLDSRPFHSDCVNVSWGKSSLRRWLNEYFFSQAFTSSEQKHILSSAISNIQTSFLFAQKSFTTQDRIFLLSAEEANSLFFSEEERMLTATAYACMRGAKCCKEKGKSWTGKSWWWLRSPGNTTIPAAYVNYRGQICYDYCFGIAGTGGTVRPALRVDLKILHTGF